jgi:hypothetical protein
MNNSYKVEESYIKALVEQAAWKPSELQKIITELEEADAAQADSELEVVEEEEEVVEEEEATHACPLCESILAEEISEDVLMEHIKGIEEALLSIIEEEEEELEEEDGPSDDELNKIGNEDGDEDAKGKKGPSKMDIKAAFKKHKAKKNEMKLTPKDKTDKKNRDDANGKKDSEFEKVRKAKAHANEKARDEQGK